MFNYFFESLSDLSKSTQLLEACDWSEERAENLLIFCASAIQEIISQENPPASYESLEIQIKNYLSGSHTENEIDILLEIIKQDLSSKASLLLQEC
tara:strand:- start:119 stop:406 length:288 start_codon:yes stop_codon:yes gene_type:complete